MSTITTTPTVHTICDMAETIYQYLKESAQFKVPYNIEDDSRFNQDTGQDFYNILNEYYSFDREFGLTRVINGNETYLIIDNIE